MCRTEVLQPFAVLPAVEQNLVHHNHQLPGPVRIELTAEILIGIECDILLEHSFQEIQKRTLARIPLFRHKKKYRKFLRRLQIQQLKIIKSQFILFSEDMLYQ